MALTLLHLSDILLWTLMAVSTVYVAFFALASVLPHRKACPHGKDDTPHGKDDGPHRRFLVLIPAYQEDSVIVNTVQSFLTHQHYPTELYTLTVISDRMQPETNQWLSEQPLTLHTPDFEKSSKAKALQYAISHIGQEERYDHVVVLDADNQVGPDFLAQLSAVCDLGYQAIQCHRTAKNNDNDIAALDGASEEINNTLFRRAHNAVGLSSALIGSGMCFDFQWFCTHVELLTSAVEDRELEALLLKERVFIKYAEDIYVKDEKVSSQDTFQRQRQRWMTGQVQTLLHMLPYLPTAMATGNINYIDKTLQQALIPRSMLVVGLAAMSLLVTVMSPARSIKWWLLLAVLCLSLVIALPPRLRTRAFMGNIATLPQLVWRMFKNIAKIDKHDTEFIHTTHTK